MVSTGLNKFITRLEEKGELVRIKTFVNPSLEITEITDRITKSGGPALLFENNGTSFPLLINAFGSDRRLSAALGRKSLEETGLEIERIFSKLTGSAGSLASKLAGLPSLMKLSGIIPSKSRKKGRCQQVIIKDPDLGIFPVLKCWPYDGGRFITLPVVHTFHPDTGHPNAGMYRMQVLSKNTAAMHWQMHKTGANHFEAWKKKGGKMPVSVILGGDPVYTYSATAPLPENIDEYILAGFLRGSKVKMVKCISNDIYVPEDADIVLEGYVDTGEYLVWEGPFGDHTGFYSLADWYPKFHITCITHASDAVYPATIVGIPPQEDAYLAKATEKIFLSPIKLSLQPEIEDLHMPDAGVAHNLVLAKIRKSYPGQGMKIINSLLGAGQMMFTKYLVVLDGDINIRNYDEVMRSVLSNTDFSRDIFFCRGPLDVLDHSSDSFAFGGKMGIDATVKTRSESADVVTKHFGYEEIVAELNVMVNEGIIRSFNFPQSDKYLPVLILSAEVTPAEDMVEVICRHIAEKTVFTFFRIIVLVDHTVDVNDLFTVAWQVLGNSDPFRDHKYISGSTLMIDGTIKFYRPGGFARRWPNVVLSEYETIKSVDKKWPDLALGDPVPSPSLKYMRLQRPGREEISNS